MSEMTYRPLGDSGLVVSTVGVGCNAFGRRVDLDGVRETIAARELSPLDVAIAGLAAQPGSRR